MFWEIVVASDNVDLVPSDGWELIDTGVDEKAFEAGHPKSHHLLEGCCHIHQISTSSIWQSYCHHQKIFEAWSTSKYNSSPEEEEENQRTSEPTKKFTLSPSVLPGMTPPQNPTSTQHWPRAAFTCTNGSDVINMILFRHNASKVTFVTRFSGVVVGGRALRGMST